MDDPLDGDRNVKEHSLAECDVLCTGNHVNGPLHINVIMQTLSVVKDDDRFVSLDTVEGIVRMNRRLIATWLQSIICLRGINGSGDPHSF
jgi:hypothetical protein